MSTSADRQSGLPVRPAFVPSDGATPERFVFLAERLWLDFVNTDDVRRGSRVDLLRDFNGYTRWLHASGVLDSERTAGFLRRAHEQPAGAGAALVDARRVRSTLRALAERGATGERVRGDALGEINRVLGRSAGTRRVEPRSDGTYTRSFVPVGDAYAGLLIPIVESAADSLLLGELARVRRCADPRCVHVFFDATRNGRRRWCDMTRCGNRAKAARHRARTQTDQPGASGVFSADGKSLTYPIARSDGRDVAVTTPLSIER